ncbi:hypothetical protein F5888DRAFT_1636604 [Russula emetica]|nr:hypothetical protein F5888DRAFT_1636604 [Russula emetica]
MVVGLGFIMSPLGLWHRISAWIREQVRVVIGHKLGRIKGPRGNVGSRQGGWLESVTGASGAKILSKEIIRQGATCMSVCFIITDGNYRLHVNFWGLLEVALLRRPGTTSRSFACLASSMSRQLNASELNASEQPQTRAKQCLEAIGRFLSLLISGGIYMLDSESRWDSPSHMVQGSKSSVTFLRLPPFLEMMHRPSDSGHPLTTAASAKRGLRAGSVTMPVATQIGFELPGVYKSQLEVHSQWWWASDDAVKRARDHIHVPRRGRWGCSAAVGYLSRSRDKSLFYPSSFPSSAYLSYISCWESEGSLAMSGRNLSGPFFLFDPLSDVGFLIARIFGHIPYLLVGGTWALGGKYEDFAIVGQDAFALVACMGTL